MSRLCYLSNRNFQFLSTTLILLSMVKFVFYSFKFYVILARNIKKQSSFVVHMDGEPLVWYTGSVWVCCFTLMIKKTFKFYVILFTFSSHITRVICIAAVVGMFLGWINVLVRHENVPYFIETSQSLSLHSLAEIYRSYEDYIQNNIPYCICFQFSLSRKVFW